MAPKLVFSVRHIFEDWKCEWGFVDDRYLHVQDINVFSNYAEARDLQYRKLAAGFDARVCKWLDLLCERRPLLLNEEVQHVRPRAFCSCRAGPTATQERQ